MRAPAVVIAARLIARVASRWLENVNRKRDSWPRVVYANSAAKSSALATLLVLAEHADCNGIAHPSVARIARLIKVSERQVQRDLQSLLTSNEITVEKHGGGKRRPTTYRITVTRMSPFHAPYGDIHERGIGSHTVTRMSGYGKTPFHSAYGDTHVTQSSKERL
jgi:hypothetical protein